MSRLLSVAVFAAIVLLIVANTASAAKHTLARKRHRSAAKMKATVATCARLADCNCGYVGRVWTCQLIEQQSSVTWADVATAKTSLATDEYANLVQQAATVGCVREADCNCTYINRVWTCTLLLIRNGPADTWIDTGATSGALATVSQFAFPDTMPAAKPWMATITVDHLPAITADQAVMATFLIGESDSRTEALCGLISCPTTADSSATFSMIAPKAAVAIAGTSTSWSVSASAGSATHFHATGTLQYSYATVTPSAPALATVAGEPATTLAKVATDCGARC